MKFTPAPLSGAFVIEPEAKTDARGFFARLFCEKEFAAHGLVTHYVQMNEAFNVKRGILRGMHYQLAPNAEVKLVRCIRGEIYDVILDLRPQSPTFGRHFGAKLSAENRAMMYVPCGFAHGYLTLTGEADLIYMVSDFYASESERGIRYDDPRFNIRWPAPPTDISDKDSNWPDFANK